MEKVILIHGSGHKASSWQKTISFLDHQEDILCPELSAILTGGRPAFPTSAPPSPNTAPRPECRSTCAASPWEASWPWTMPWTTRRTSRPWCSIGTPHKVPKFAFALQNVVFRLLPKSTFTSMAFDKKDTFALGNSMKNLDFSGRLGEVQCPTLILCGEKDGANLKSARFLAGHIPGAELQVLENTGHVVNEENPRALAERLNAFYGRHR